MSTSTVQLSGTSTIQEIARTIIKEYDANKDGQFSSDEFASFLDGFVKSLGSVATTGSTTKSAVTTSALLATSSASQPLAAAAASVTTDPLPGWDATKWYNTSHNSIKYVAGRIMAQYSPSDWLDATRRDQIVASFKAAGLNPTLIGKDKVDFGDGHVVDIVQGASDGGRAWQWLVP